MPRPWPGPHTLRALDAPDIGAAAAMLSRAFRDDPAYRFLLPDPASRGPRLEALFSRLLALRLGINDARVLLDGDRTVALVSWAQPDARSPSLADLLLHGLPWLPLLWGIAAFRRMLAADAATGTLRARYTPPEPHAYLSLLAVDPDRQGEGLGRALLRHTLACSAGSGPASLVTTSEPNVPFYRSEGFEVTHHARIEDAFDAWIMVRGAQPPQG